MGITRDNFRPGESLFIKDVLRDGEPGVVKLGTRSIGGRPFRVVGLFSSGYAFGDNQMFLPFRTFQRHYGDSLLENMLVSYTLSPTYVAVLVVGTALVGGLGSLYALYKAHRLSPIEALRS